ncbi:hypothetical protein [Trichothermofontia sp.]
MAVELLAIDLGTVHHTLTHSADLLQAGLPAAGSHALIPDVITSHASLLAQQFNQDVFADIRKGFNHFVQTGQVWAMLIGFVLGYLFKSATSY